MTHENKPAWLLETLASAREGKANDTYIRTWVAQHNARMDAERGRAQLLTDEDNAEIQHLLDKDRRGPMV